ncbi:MAG: hypothetical protein OEV44_02800 [Spirochaetota bacterium]|nr:hypothetical protein [Spirochaetota bacterium]
MLKNAYSYEEEINKTYLSLINKNPEYLKYYFHSCFYENKLYTKAEDTWGALSYVSIHEDKLLGFVEALIKRPEGYIESLKLINFTEKTNFYFSKDIKDFIDKLFFDYDYYKITFCVVVGNPAEKTYDKLIKLYQGKVSGYFTKNVKLIDGKLYDVKHYEIFKGLQNE